jgi:hypothetical protein
MLAIRCLSLSLVLCACTGPRELAPATPDLAHPEVIERPLGVTHVEGQRRHFVSAAWIEYSLGRDDSSALPASAEETALPQRGNDDHASGAATQPAPEVIGPRSEDASIYAAPASRGGGAGDPGGVTQSPAPEQPCQAIASPTASPPVHP